MEDLGKHEPLWIDTAERLPDYPALEENISADVAVIGGGIAGITCAYLLKNEGLNVALIEMDKLGKGVSGRTTAKLTSQHGLIYDTLIKRAGTKNARLYHEANEKAIDFVESLVKEKNINCDFERVPSYVFTQEDSYISRIISETRAAHNLGIQAEYVTEIPLPLAAKAALRFDNQAQFHVMKYLNALVKETESGNCRIYEHTKAVDILQRKINKVVTDRKYLIEAKHIIIATHFPFYDKPGLYFTRLYPDRSYIVAFSINGEFTKGNYVTAEYPGFSLRSQPLNGEQAILLAGEDHRTGCGEYLYKHYVNLRDLAGNIFYVKQMLYHWSAQDYATPSRLPYAGRLSSINPDIYVATGFDKWGMANGTAAARVICDIIMKRRNPYKELFSPCRMADSFGTAGDFIKENAATMSKLISRKFQAVPEVIDIKNGEARIVDYDEKLLGVYRDEKGKLHTVKASCAHMGCRLSFNDAEKTWDCPCHGSRYDIDGNNIEAPAFKPVK